MSYHLQGLNPFALRRHRVPRKLLTFTGSFLLILERSRRGWIRIVNPDGILPLYAEKCNDVISSLRGFQSKLSNIAKTHRKADPGLYRPASNSSLPLQTRFLSF